MEKISKIDKASKIKKGQKQNEYKITKKKNSGYKEILEEEEEKLDKKATEQKRKKALDAYKIQIQMGAPIRRKIINNIENININQDEERE